MYVCSLPGHCALLSLREGRGRIGEALQILRQVRQGLRPPLVSMHLLSCMYVCMYVCMYEERDLKSATRTAGKLIYSSVCIEVYV